MPIIEAIATIANPTIEPQSRQNLTELSESEKNNVLDNVLTQIILDENKPKPKAPDETLTDAIANTAAPSTDNPLPDETLSDATTKQITYNLNHDGSVILRSLRGITNKQLKRMSDDELRAIGLFKTLRGKDEKFFPKDKTLELRYQEKSKPIAATAKPKATKKQSTKSDADKRFTAMAAAAYYTQKTGQPLKETTLIANAKKYGFMIKEKGSGLYALIDS